ncbi:MULTISPECIES: hypothetical protein [unclassified Rhizobium]|uniref:hypothetical protein n=1 Tax=unclassified Rhizobium TaxID=2613769 RepID=UPI000EAAB753|nr:MULTISPECIES: hypothetical protein [unclassified Rhizobium]AYG66407.1 hypothetical protein CCGE531_10675 [Rhizobium sp. CCGE531]AYG72788.1 hypothetical protein CCGE532_10100 [Rhizobium sp. CCGE532]
MNNIKKRVVLHFPGFEPLDAAAHRARYERSARQSAAVWDFSVSVDELKNFGRAPYFDVTATAADWQTQSRIHIVDHNDLVSALNGRPFFTRLMQGYLAAAKVAASGGMVGYFRHAWRFGLFFVFPFLLMLAGLLISLSIAFTPFVLGLPGWSHIGSIALAVAFLVYVFLPQAEKLHTMHLFSDWEMAVAMAGLNGLGAKQWLEAGAISVRQALDEPDIDEFVISSHSMGSSVAAHVIGLLLEREPELLEGKRVVFMTLGSAILQCALMRPATVLRSRVGLIARCKEIFWLDVHCLTDAIHFYKVKVAAVCGHPDAEQASILFVRFKQMLSTQHYAKIKRDFLRVHRQYVLGPDVKAFFDFTLISAGPLPASHFAEFSSKKLPELAFNSGEEAQALSIGR